MTDIPWFGVGTFAAEDAVAFPGLVVAETVLDLRRAFGTRATTLDLLDDWDASLPALRDLAATLDADGRPLAGLRALPPVRPRQLLCAGANYFQHVREIMFSSTKNGGDERPDAEIRAEAE